MTVSRIPRRAVLLGLVGLAACDVAQVALDPTFPGVIQTWSLPASEMSIGVGELLPTGIVTNSAGTAFIVAVDGVNYSRRVGDYCALCQALNGTTAPKPAFIISPDAGSTTSLPDNVDSATVLGATLTYAITNSLSFDPIRVNPSDLAAPQGKMVITIRSGSQVLGLDSIMGTETTMPPGTTTNRTLPPCSTLPSGSTAPCFATGKVRGAISVDLLVDSPLGEAVFINANGVITATASVADLEVASATIRVTSAPMNSDEAQEVPQDLPEGLVDNIQSGRLELTITNPFDIAGNVDMIFNVRPGLSYTKTIAMPSGAIPVVRTVTFTGPELTEILKGNNDNPTTFSMSGTVSSPAGITVTPADVVSIANRLVFAVRVGGN